MMRLLLVLVFAAFAAISPASAQPTNVRAWYAKGQVFVIWQFPAPPVNETDTIEIYASAAAQVSVANMDRVGRLFFPEYTGARLKNLDPAARLRIPTPAGGTYVLAGNEGVFVYTPHAAGNLFFAVVQTGSTLVGAANSAATAFAYDPVNNPIVAHEQFRGFTPGGNPYRAYAVWADGFANASAPRPDFPVTASPNKNGVPHAFAITLPINALPNEPLSCVFAIHGGEGEYQSFRPGVASRANVSLNLDDGIVVSPDDSIFTNVEGALERLDTDWFGYTPLFDPFSIAPRQMPAGDSVVINFTTRRVHWIIDWLTGPTSPFVIDRERIAMIGHSAGGRGTSHLTRQRPELFCAAIAYTPASYLDPNDAGRVNFLTGSWSQNLLTSVLGPDGSPLHLTDLFTPTTRISPTQRDLPLTRYYYGKRDDNGTSSGWSTEQRAIVDSLNNSRHGYMIAWDEREHGVEKWNLETSDATDAYPGPWPDVAQWIVPPASIGGDKTERARAQYLVDTYRRSDSYPAFYNSDSDPLLASRQPDPGPGDPDLGEPWGTWTGYFEWERDTLTDQPRQWACTVYSTGLATTPIDNSPFASITTDFVPRRTRHFSPAANDTVQWFAFDVATGVRLQSGSALVDSDKLVAVEGLVVPKDPERVRVVLCAPSACPGDANASGAVNFDDITAVLANFGALYARCDGAGDANADGSVTFDDITTALANFGRTCP